jgi:hypothetical protein
MNTRIVLAKRPAGRVDESCFAIEDCPEPACDAEHVLLEAIYLSTDPYLRGRMNAGPSHAPGFAIGQAIASRVAAREIVRTIRASRSAILSGVFSTGHCAAWRHAARG